MPVNKDRVRLLVDALRSGEYEQGTGVLRTQDDTYCCVGVGCDVARKNGIGIDWTVSPTNDLASHGDGTGTISWHFDGIGTIFSRRLMDWYGFESRNAFDGDPEIAPLGPLNYSVTMIGANDTEKWTFEKIADALEKCYLDDEVNE